MNIDAFLLSSGISKLAYDITTNSTMLVAAWIVISLTAVVYFLPSLIAWMRRKRNVAAIAALNLLLGWTLLGWTAAFVWALLQDAKPAAPTPSQQV